MTGATEMVEQAATTRSLITRTSRQLLLSTLGNLVDTLAGICIAIAFTIYLSVEVPWLVQMVNNPLFLPFATTSFIMFIVYSAGQHASGSEQRTLHDPDEFGDDMKSQMEKVFSISAAIIYKPTVITIAALLAVWLAEYPIAASLIAILYPVFDYRFVEERNVSPAQAFAIYITSLGIWLISFVVLVAMVIIRVQKVQQELRDFRDILPGSGDIQLVGAGTSSAPRELFITLQNRRAQN
jgi:hypothetical protein